MNTGSWRREEQAINTIREEERWNVGMIEVQLAVYYLVVVV